MIQAPTRRKRQKPEAKRLPNDVLDDRRLGLDDLFFLIWRAHHAVKWTSRPEQLKEERGFGADLFYQTVNRLKQFGYLERKQSRVQASGFWEYANEKLNLKAAPGGERDSYTLLNAQIEAGLEALKWRPYTLAIYLRSHASDFVLSAKDIGARFSLSTVQIKRIVKPLVAAKLVEVRTIRDARGRLVGGGYAASAWRSAKRTAISPEYHLPETDFTGNGKIRVHNSLQEKTLQLRCGEKTRNSVSAGGNRKSITPPLGATAQRLFADDGKSKLGTTAKQRKAAKEQRDLAKLYRRTGIEELFDAPASYAEAAKHVSAQLQAKASIGAEMYDAGEGKQLIEVEFFDTIGLDGIEETLCISDRALSQGIKQATAGRMKACILGEQGLLTARRIIARLMQDDLPARDAFGALLAEIQKATKEKGHWFNSWNLIARRIAGELYGWGAERMLQQARPLAERFKRRDLNHVLAPRLFTKEGLAELSRFLSTYDADDIAEAVSEYLLRGMTDHEIAPGSISTWRYFAPYIREQSEEAA
jgi:hypothetical protein